MAHFFNDNMNEAMAMTAGLAEGDYFLHDYPHTLIEHGFSDRVILQILEERPNRENVLDVVREAFLRGRVDFAINTLYQCGDDDMRCGRDMRVVILPAILTNNLRLHGADPMTSGFLTFVQVVDEFNIRFNANEAKTLISGVLHQMGEEVNEAERANVIMFLLNFFEGYYENNLASFAELKRLVATVIGGYNGRNLNPESRARVMNMLL